MTAGEEMTERGSSLHHEYLRIERAQAHGAPKVLDRTVRLTDEDSQPTARVPCHRQVWIDGESVIDKRHGGVEIACNEAKRMRAPGERDRTILAQLRRSSREPCGFSIVVSRVGHPVIY